MLHHLPPPPLTQEEFTKRRKAGAKTFAEVDPEFVAWLKKEHELTMRAKKHGLIFSLLFTATIIIIIFAFFYLK